MVARPTRLVVVGAAALIALAGCTASNAEPQPTPSESASASTARSAPDDLAAFYGQKVRWEGCGGDFQCTKLKVPADYDNPGDATLELDVVRVRAKDPKGSLILNPGGPGGSGVEYARAARAVLTPQLADAYDVVGFDPRGVVNSSPVDCIDDSKLDALFASDGTPDTPQEVADLAATSKLFGVGCKSKSPEVAPVHGHRVRGPRHGHPAGGPRRREAELPGQELRHLPGRPVRGAVPRQGREDGDRRRAAQLAGLRRDHPRPGQGVRRRPATVRRGLHHAG